jgi:hypothetical protein
MRLAVAGGVEYFVLADMWFCEVRGLADCYGLVSGCVMVWGAELLVALL